MFVVHYSKQTTWSVKDRTKGRVVDPAG